MNLLELQRENEALKRENKKLKHYCTLFIRERRRVDLESICMKVLELSWENKELKRENEALKKEEDTNLHHDLELAVALGALPLGDEVEHVDLREKRETKSAVVELR